MSKFVSDFENLIKTSNIEQIGKLIEQLAEITENMTDDELQMLDGCSVPHYLASLKYYNSICEKGGNPENNSYLDLFRAFIKSEEFSKFTAYKAVKNSNGQKGEKSGSGGTQYSEESVDERQYIIDSFIEEFLDVNFKMTVGLNDNDTDNTDDTDKTDNQLTIEFFEAVMNDN